MKTKEILALVESIDRTIVQKLRNFLEDDLGNSMITDPSEIDGWAEAAYADPKVEKILSLVPSDQIDKYYEVIDDIISDLVDQVEEELAGG